jgi:hypothetical protein
MTNWRPATIDEAVDSIMRCMRKESRKEQLSFFKDHNGEAFANEVKRLVEAKFKKKIK